MVRDDFFDGVFRQERGLGGGREKERRGRGKKACDQNKRLSPYFAIPFMAQRFGRRRRGTSHMRLQPPLPGRVQASNTRHARASRLHTGRGWAGGHQAGAQFAKSSQSISPWRLRAHGQWTPPQACRTYLVGGGRGAYHRRQQQADEQGRRHDRGCGDCRETKVWRAINKRTNVCDQADIPC